MKVIQAEPVNHHYCDLPGWWRRRKHGLGLNSVIECECGQRWAWTSGYSGTSWRREA